jgi:hypothetical protein
MSPKPLKKEQKIININFVHSDVHERLRRRRKRLKHHGRRGICHLVGRGEGDTYFVWMQKVSQTT